jgi:hypothetical protein
MEKLHANLRMMICPVPLVSAYTLLPREATFERQLQQQYNIACLGLKEIRHRYKG